MNSHQLLKAVEFMLTNLHDWDTTDKGSNCHYYRHGVHAGRKRVQQ